MIALTVKSPAVVRPSWPERRRHEAALLRHGGAGPNHGCALRENQQEIPAEAQAGEAGGPEAVRLGRERATLTLELKGLESPPLRRTRSIVAG